MQHNAIFTSEQSLNLVKSPRISPPSNAETIRIIDLFCGAGAMTAGTLMSAYNANRNLEVFFAADIDGPTLDVYRENFGSITNNLIKDDLAKIFSSPGSKVNPEERHYLNQTQGVDLLMAGPPCQGHSDLNNSTRRMDPRNELYFVVPRVIELFSPCVAIIENVPGVVHSKDRVVNRTKEFLVSIGYSLKEIVVDFLSLGIPQTRKRHILIASKNDVFMERVLKNTVFSETPKLKSWIADLPSFGNPLLDKETVASRDNAERINYLFQNQLFDLPNDLRPSCHREGNHSYNSVYGRLNPDKPAQTITSGFGSMGQGRYVHPYKKRTITAREAARIQGFPDWFSFNTVDKITVMRRIIANAVPPALTYSITNDFLTLCRTTFSEDKSNSGAIELAP